MNENMLKGVDGNFYSTSEELRRADKDWNRRNLLYLGHDGNFYSTSEELNEANRRYWQTLKPKEYPSERRLNEMYDDLAKERAESERRLNEMCGNSARREAEMMKKMVEKKYSIKNFNKN